MQLGKMMMSGVSALAALAMSPSALLPNTAVRPSEPEGKRVKGKNRPMRKRVYRTGPAMLKRRACNVKHEDGKMRFTRGKLIGGRPQLFRP